MKRADGKRCAAANWLSRRLTSVQSLQALGELAERTGEKLRDSGLITGHMLARIETLTQSGPGKPQVDVLSCTIDRDHRFRYLDSQLNTLIDTHTTDPLPASPRLWPTGQTGWVDPASDLRLSAARKGKLPVSLFCRISSQTFGFLAIEAAPNFHPGHFYAFHSIGLQLLDRMAGLATPSSTVLNRSEKRCLYWSACGKTSHEIALILDLSEHTVNHYIAIASSKLNARNRVHAVAKAIRFGLIRTTEIL